MQNLFNLPFVSDSHTPWMSVGHPQIVLEGVYDADQLWLSFAAGMIFRIQYTPEMVEDESLVTNEQWLREYYSCEIRRRINAPFGNHLASLDSSHFPPPQRDVPQYALPFNEYRCLTGERRKEVHRTNYPTFDRDEENKLYQVQLQLVSRKDYFEIEEWCLNNLDGRFIITSYDLYVERRDDYMLARLKF